MTSRVNFKIKYWFLLIVELYICIDRDFNLISNLLSIQYLARETCNVTGLEGFWIWENVTQSKLQCFKPRRTKLKTTLKKTSNCPIFKLKIHYSTTFKWKDRINPREWSRTRMTGVSIYIYTIFISYTAFKFESYNIQSDNQLHILPVGVWLIVLFHSQHASFHKQLKPFTFVAR